MTEEYKYTLQDFVEEFGWDIPKYESSIGIEFINKGQLYRMCREPADEFRCYLIKVINTKFTGKETPFNDLKYDILKVYDKFEELLESTLIDEKPFKDMLFDENTTILSRD